MRPGSNSIEKLKAEKDGLDILDEIEAIAREHGGWESMDAATRERLKWIGTFYRKPTPGCFMMRVRITGGQANSRQLRALAAIGRSQGNCVLDITTRQQIELRAIRIKSVPEILRTLEDVDLSALQTGMDNVRNVNTCPLAGLTPAELFDASPVARSLTRIFLGNREFTNLPRKFNVTITGCRENCTPAETQDLAMVPAIRAADGRPGFNVLVGGKMGSGGMTVAQPLDVFVLPEQAADFAAGLILLFRDEGPRDQRSRARFAFLVEEWGLERLRAEMERRLGRELERSQRDARLRSQNDHLGVQLQKQAGLCSVGVAVPVGRLSSDDLDEAARLADAYGSGRARLTPDQNLIFPDVAEASLPAFLSEPFLRRFPADPHPFVRGLVSCTGTDYCNLAQIETKGLGRALAERLASRYSASMPLRMHWSGCPAGCGNHQAADIGFQGMKARIDGEVVDAVSVFAGGRTGPDARPGEKVREVVPVSMLDEVVPLVLENLEALKRERRGRAATETVVMVPAVADKE
ncbi:MAG TPA: ferredoxin--nitrite reductase [Dehalococcoidia bacterium]|nr:ferredoxin--nitrite reductase [Dehalococcoidia bacterium]